MQNLIHKPCPEKRDVKKSHSPISRTLTGRPHHQAEEKKLYFWASAELSYCYGVCPSRDPGGPVRALEPTVLQCKAHQTYLHLLLMPFVGTAGKRRGHEFHYYSSWLVGKKIKKGPARQIWVDRDSKNLPVVDKVLCLLDHTLAALRPEPRFLDCSHSSAVSKHLGTLLRFE